MNKEEYDEFITYIFNEYRLRKAKGNMYEKDIELFENILRIYFQKDRQPYFKEIIEKYKDLYIFDESKIEPNVSYEEKLGLGEVYDYINDFDFEKDKFNVFITSLIIHQKLYSKCNGSGFGGKLRTTNVSLKDLDIDVVDPTTSTKLFNVFLDQNISDLLFKNLDNNNLFGYINNAIILCTTLIKIQPFQDGNKRTFRSLLNLLFKRVNIPPVFIDQNERSEYKNALIKALKNNDFRDIIKFYYYKICDAIILLDIENSIDKVKKI